MKPKLLPIVALVFCMLMSSLAYSRDKGYYYQLKIYHFKTAAQEAQVDQFLKDAYIPAMHRAGIPAIGVFKPVVQDTADQRIYVFTPVAKFEQLLNIDNTLAKDSQFQSAGAPYLNAAYNNAPYTRIETIIMKAFEGMLKPAIPNLTSPKSERIYELRSYESATEKLADNKVDMFNFAELDIFTKLNFNAVFYGKVISGGTMPNLMYMTTFNNKTDRDEHWKAFSPEYAPVSKLPQYQHNVSKNVTLFLYPTDYSNY
ncbi:NIPSNAP family protein [Albibacterium bauzanense]|uniref:NIPSNAP protein n=1 Tax=Albibacterium bauzanense TaxID=653929 RepID=A0A4R1M288_9SPHI|nr:NIPSNAP family protein [Albibacterium bauzanense]TCK85497.1 NIPSNAP protein [Albibacterium bauzanense]